MNSTIPSAGRASAIRRGEPIEALGLKLYPITMAQYEEFLSVQDSLTFRIATLPPRYLSYDYLSALFACELDSGGRMGHFFNALRFLHMALREPFDLQVFTQNITFEENTKPVKIKTMKIKQKSFIAAITPKEFSTTLRPILAEQNGLELPDESANLDIIADAEKLKTMHATLSLKFSIGEMIASVAYQSHVSEREIVSWTIREFEARKRAIDRDKRYMLYNAAELSGMVKFKNGSPAPSWLFDLSDDRMGTVQVDQVTNNIPSAPQF